MKNFEQMTPKELREYIRKNPTNDEAILVRMKQIEVDPNAINVAYGTSGKDIETILSQTNSLNK
jgi:hypothetical protein